MFHDFANTAAAQGANVTLETWPERNHDFQAFGDLQPQSKAALARLGDVSGTI